jgi:hypothetical protein
MMGDGSPSDFYQNLSTSNRRIVDMWTNRRSEILCSSLQKQVEAKIEEHDMGGTRSTRFLKVQVMCLDDAKGSVPEANAMLTLWSPSEEQLDEIKDGLMFRMKNLQVKPGRFDCLAQLSAGSNTPMKLITDTKKPKTGRFANISRLLTASARLKAPNHGNILEANIVGVVLRVECVLGSTLEVFLTDETGKLLCVKIGVHKKREIHFHLSHLSDRSFENMQDICTLAAFQYLRLTGLDEDRSCVVLQYTEKSTFSPNPMGRRIERLKRWSSSSLGKIRLVQLASCNHLGMQPPPSQQLCVIGYCSGLQILANSQLIIFVDCGSLTLKALKFPLSLLSGFLDSCNDSDGVVFLNKQDEILIEKLKRLGSILRSQRSLYIFHLRPLVDPEPNFPHVEYEIKHASVADTRALAALYLATMPCV